MNTWTRVIRTDRNNLMERVCPHGIGHPDPDSLEWLSRTGVRDDGDHACDGCCEKGRPGTHRAQRDRERVVGRVHDVATEDMAIGDYCTRWPPARPTDRFKLSEPAAVAGGGRGRGGRGTARVWRLYMAASAINFEAGRTQVHQVLAVRADRGRSDMPLRPTF